MIVQQPIPCPICKAPVFVRENGNIIAHYNGDGERCAANETKMNSDCWKQQAVRQGIVEGSQLSDTEQERSDSARKYLGSLPVEAKEKERTTVPVEIAHALWCEGGRLRSNLSASLDLHPENWHKEGLMQRIDKWDEAAGRYFDFAIANPIAEPKPTPSTPAKYECPVCYWQMSEPASEYNICSRCGTEFENDDEVKTYEQLRRDWINAGAKFFFKGKPQPDSSSISTERCPYCNGTKDQCFDNEYCASTHWPKTVSTEQTFEEGSHKAAIELLSFLDIRFRRGQKYANSLEQTIAICIEQNMKAAAKGQSDGRS